MRAGKLAHLPRRDVRSGATVLLVIVSAAIGSPAASQTPADLYYRGPVPGSEGTYSPLRGILNSGYYHFQMDNRGDDPFAVPYGPGIRNVMKSLLNPFGTVAEYGVGRFFTNEVLPNLHRESGQWVPNYLGHTLGEGLVFRYSYEWYRYHRVPHAKVMAAMSVVTGALLNEVVENGAYEGGNVDPIADFYIFNPLGMLLFSSDRAAAFLRSELGMAYWPLQALYDPEADALDNVGYRIVARWHPNRARFGVFATYGNQGLVGLSYRSPWGVTLSAAGGAAGGVLEPVIDSSGQRTITSTVVPAAGLFVDRDGSLLASIVVAPRKAESVALNVFPGVLGPAGFRPGLVFMWGESVGVRFGLTVAQLPVGFGVRLQR